MTEICPNLTSRDARAKLISISPCGAGTLRTTVNFTNATVPDATVNLIALVSRNIKDAWSTIKC